MSKEKSPFDTDAIRVLAEILKDTDLTEIEVEEKGLKIRVARQISYAANVNVPMAQAVGAPIAAVPSAPAPALSVVEKPTGKGGVPEGAVTSPMVGTAYLAAAPDKPKFVELGAEVKQGQTLLTIEAMKTFNEIPAPRAGKVTQILVENGQPVEFGQALVVIS